MLLLDALLKSSIGNEGREVLLGGWAVLAAIVPLHLPFMSLQVFTVQLTLGEQTWEAEGSSIKKAHHSAASKALSETTLPKPTPRPPKTNINNNPGKSWLQLLPILMNELSVV